MRRVVAAVAAVAIVSVTWSVVVRAQGETHKVYLPMVRRDATWTPTVTPSPTPTPTRGVECGTVFEDGFEQDGVWTSDNNDFAKIVSERPFAGKRALRLAPKKNGDVAVRSTWFPWSSAENGIVVAAKLTAHWRAESSDDDVFDDDLWLSVENYQLGGQVGLTHIGNQDAGGSWNVISREYTDDRPIWLEQEIPRMYFEAYAAEDDGDRTTWWVDDVRVETCVKPAP